MTSQTQARHMAKADAQVHATSELKHVEQKKTWLQRLKSLQGSKASRAAMLDQLHAFSLSARAPGSTAPTPATPAVPGRSESAFPLYASARPSTAHSHYPSRPAPPSSGSQSARPAASFRSVSRLRGGVDPAAPAAMLAPLAKSRGEAVVSATTEESCDSVGRRLAHRRSASRHPNPQAAPAPSPAAPPANASGATRFPSNPHARHPSNPKARHPTAAATATSRHPAAAAAATSRHPATTAHRVSPAAHRMSPSARTSAFARSIAATASGTNHLSPPASRRAARQ